MLSPNRSMPGGVYCLLLPGGAWCSAGMSSVGVNNLILVRSFSCFFLPSPLLTTVYSCYIHLTHVNWCMVYNTSYIHNCYVYFSCIQCAGRLATFLFSTMTKMTYWLVYFFSVRHRESADRSMICCCDFLVQDCATKGTKSLCNVCVIPLLISSSIYIFFIFLPKTQYILASQEVNC